MTIVTYGVYHVGCDYRACPFMVAQHYSDLVNQGTLYGFAVSAKRYELFNVGAPTRKYPEGQTIVRKISGHGPGHLRRIPSYDQSAHPLTAHVQALTQEQFLVLHQSVDAGVLAPKIREHTLPNLMTYPGIDACLEFLDTRQLARALLGPCDGSLEALCRMLKTATQKTEAPGDHGQEITDTYLDYARNDVQCTVELYIKLRDLYKLWGIKRRITKIYSEASVGKGLYKDFGVKSFFGMTPEPNATPATGGQSGVFAFTGSRVTPIVFGAGLDDVFAGTQLSDFDVGVIATGFELLAGYFQRLQARQPVDNTSPVTKLHRVSRHDISAYDETAADVENRVMADDQPRD